MKKRPAIPARTPIMIAVGEELDVKGSSLGILQNSSIYVKDGLFSLMKHSHLLRFFSGKQTPRGGFVPQRLHRLIR